MLTVPATTAPANPAAVPIALISTVLQLLLNVASSGMGQTLTALINTAVGVQKQSAGVRQFYTIGISGICYGSLANSSAINEASPFNLTACVSYSQACAYVSNLTRNTSNFTLLGAVNATLPALQLASSSGAKIASTISIVSGIIFAIFIIALIGNAASILLSLFALFAPSNTLCRNLGAGITMLSSQMLQIAAFTGTSISSIISSGVNSTTNIFGISVITGSKHLTFLWIGYLATQGTNIYWINVWFVKYRRVAFQRRLRTSREINSGYGGIFGEVIGYFVILKEEEDIKALTKVEIQN